MLTPLQRQVALIVAGIAEAHDFVLAGGAALISKGEVTRTTGDLDFFGLDPKQVDELLPRLIEALGELGWKPRLSEPAQALHDCQLRKEGSRLKSTLALTLDCSPRSAAHWA